MKHLGDIAKINGAEIEPVWCITGGSPCQDLSVAGKRKGLKHSDLGDGETTRSGLFMEQVRIVKEMRERDRRAGRPDELVRPRFLVWENVPGAFSSNFKDGFGDFGAVLEEIVRIAEPTFSLPRLQGKQKWTKSGALDGDGWSIAWRTHDAQYWGVPQRRRRISIVADFGGKCAGEISFERKGVRGNFETFKTAGQGTAGDAAPCTGADDCEGECVGDGAERGLDAVGCDLYNLAVSGDVAVSLTANTGTSCTHSGPTVAIPYTLKIRDENILDDQGGIAIVEKHLMDAYQHQGWRESNVCGTLTAGQNNTVRGDTPLVCTAYNLKIRSGCDGGGKVARTDDYQRKCDGFPIGFRPENIRIYEETATTICNGTRPGFCNGVIVSYDARGNGDGHTVSTLTGDHENRITDYTSVVCEPIPIHDKATRYKGGGPTRNGDGAGNGLGVGKSGDPCPTLSTCDHHMVCYCMAHGQANAEILEDKSPCLNCNHEQPIIFDKDMYGTYQNTGIGWWNESQVGATLRTPCGGDSTLANICVENHNTHYIVRRLTPMECERLQGYPDNWTDIGDWVDSKGKKHKGDADSPRYKALGNSIALPFWYWMFCRMAKYLPEDATLGSLFDGIGGFPACWEAIHGKGTARWASEIEEFPIAVTKMRFPEEE